MEVLQGQHTFNFCQFENAEINNATLNNCKIESSSITKNSKIFHSECKNCMIEDSSLVKMKSCKECYISNSTVELSKIVNSNLFSSNLYQSHLLDCNVFKGSCDICEIKNTKMAHLKMVQAYVSESEMTDWTYCYDCCIHQSDIFQIVLNNSIYYHVEGRENKTQFVNGSKRTGRALVCPWFNYVYRGP